MTLEPYSGSLLRLAIVTIAIISLLAVALAFWENALASDVRADVPTGSHSAITR